METFVYYLCFIAPWFKWILLGAAGITLFISITLMMQPDGEPKKVFKATGRWIIILLVVSLFIPDGRTALEMAHNSYPDSELIQNKFDELFIDFD